MSISDPDDVKNRRRKTSTDDETEQKKDTRQEHESANTQEPSSKKTHPQTDSGDGSEEEGALVDKLTPDASTGIIVLLTIFYIVVFAAFLYDPALAYHYPMIGDNLGYLFLLTFGLLMTYLYGDKLVDQVLALRGKK